jgi:hypothetical protein
MQPAECIAGETTLKNYYWVIWNAKAVLTVDGSASHIIQTQMPDTLWTHQLLFPCTGEQPIPGPLSPVFNLQDYSSCHMSP